MRREPSHRVDALRERNPMASVRLDRIRGRARYDVVDELAAMTRCVDRMILVAVCGSPQSRKCSRARSAEDGGYAGFPSAAAPPRRVGHVAAAQRLVSAVDLNRVPDAASGDRQLFQLEVRCLRLKLDAPAGAPVPGCAADVSARCASCTVTADEPTTPSRRTCPHAGNRFRRAQGWMRAAAPF